MGIRYEKDTILNWINEMGKFLRLLVDAWDGPLEKIIEPATIESGYQDFFNKERTYFLNLSDSELIEYSATLEKEQIRPLAQLLMYYGFLHQDSNLVLKAKVLLEYYMQQTGSFSFEDYGYLNEMKKYLQ